MNLDSWNSRRTRARQRVVEYRDGNRDEYNGLHIKGALNTIREKEDSIVAEGGRLLKSQRDADEYIIRTFRYVNERLPLSVAFCKANAAEANVPVHKYIQQLNQGDIINEPINTRLVIEMCRVPNMCTVYVEIR